MNSKALRISITDMYFRIICLFPIFTTLVDGTIINKVMFVGMFSLHVLSMLFSPVKRKTAILLIIFVFHYIFAVCITDFPLSNLNLLFYFPFYLMYTYYVCDNTDRVRRWFLQHERYIYGIVRFWTIMVGISIIVPSCYYIKEGGSLYFGSWCNDIFRLGPSAIFIQMLVICLQVLKKEKFVLHYMIVPLYCVFMGSARTYFFVGLCMFVISWYMFCNSQKKFWITAVPIAILGFIALTQSSMWDKMLYSLDTEGYGGFWFRFTSSRSQLWTVDMQAWKSMPIINKLLGCGIDFTADVSGKWGHNDFVEIVCSFGILGLIHYLFAMTLLYRTTMKVVCLPLYIRLVVLMVWLFNAFFNMHYVYFCAMLSYPLLLVALQIYKPSGKQNQVKLRRIRLKNFNGHIAFV